jgi:hypothetical protein
VNTSNGSAGQGRKALNLSTGYKTVDFKGKAIELNKTLYFCFSFSSSHIHNLNQLMCVLFVVQEFFFIKSLYKLSINCLTVAFLCVSDGAFEELVMDILRLTDRVKYGTAGTYQQNTTLSTCQHPSQHTQHTASAGVRCPSAAEISATVLVSTSRLNPTQEGPPSGLD